MTKYRGRTIVWNNNLFYNQIAPSLRPSRRKSEQTVDTTNTIQRGEVDVPIYRSSSDPPDMFSMEDYYADPVGVYARVRAAYNTGIPFPALIRDQSMQFAEFNFTAAEVVAEK